MTTTWLLIEQRRKDREAVALYDVRRNGRSYAYDLELGVAQHRIMRDRRFSATDSVVLVDRGGLRSPLVLDKLRRGRSLPS